MIKYFPAPDVKKNAIEISTKAGIPRDFTRIHFIRSRGSVSRRTIARCHSFPRILQVVLSMKANYIIEVISEKFDKLDDTSKAKTIIHELMHIPESMKGGFRHHDYVCERNIEKIFRMYSNSTESI